MSAHIAMAESNHARARKTPHICLILVYIQIQKMMATTMIKIIKIKKHFSNSQRLLEMDVQYLNSSF